MGQQQTDGNGTIQQNDDLNDASRQFQGQDNQEEELLDDDEDMNDQQYP